MKLESLFPQVAKLELIHPGTGATGVFLHVVGQDTKVFRDKAREIARSISKTKGQTADPVEMEREGIELVAACIVGWSDEEAFGVYSPARALELMQMDELGWVREQVEAFVKERANFFRPAK